MKKLLLAFMVALGAVCAYANTCTYSGVQVSLKSETVVLHNNGYVCNGLIFITVSDASKKEVRCQVEIGNQRKWITVKLKNGEGSYDIGSGSSLPSGSYTVKLIAGPGSCY